MWSRTPHAEDPVAIAGTFCRLQTGFDLVPQTTKGLEILRGTTALISFQRNTVHRNTAL